MGHLIEIKVEAAQQAAPHQVASSFYSANSKENNIICHGTTTFEQSRFSQYINNSNTWRSSKLEVVQYVCCEL